MLLAWLLLVAFYQLTDITQLFVFFVTVIICWRVFDRQMFYQIKQQFQLNEQGIWQWVNEAGELERWQINEKSRVAFYGCYLTLEPCDQNSNESALFNQAKHQKNLTFKFRAKQQFIFKDSLSVEDYARLCRVIKRLNVAPIQAVLK